MEQNNSIILRCENVAKKYRSGDRDLEVLSGLDLHVVEHQFIAVTGESGCGKSTLLHLLGCLDHQTAGELYFRDEPYSKLSTSQKNRLRNRNFGFVFQFHHLLPEFDAIENVMMPGLIAGTPQRDLLERAKGLLEELRLPDRMRHKPKKLSGGEQQRVAVARSVINQPDILFMDEPTGNLDPENSLELIGMVRDLQKSRGLTVIIVTHNREIAALADIHYVLSGGKVEKQ